MLANEKTALLMLDSQQPATEYKDISFRNLRATSLAIHKRPRQRCTARKVSIWVLAATLALLLLTAFYLSPCGVSAKDNYTFDFDLPRDVSIIESLELPGIAIQGGIHVREAPVDQKSTFNVQITLSSKRRRNGLTGLNIKRYPTELKIFKSRRQKNLGLWWRWLGLLPRVHLYVIISVEKDATLCNFSISSENLPIYLDPALSMTVSNQTTFETRNSDISHPVRTGMVSVNAFQSRRTYIHSRSGVISGVYSLYDVLWLTSRSGQIAITAIPKNASKDLPEHPAELTAVVRSGSVAIHVNTLSPVPARDYRTTVRSRSGTIRGSYLHGSMTELRSRSGDISARVVPFNASNEVRTILQTESKSGQQDIHVERPLHMAEDGSLGSLESRHYTKSGNMRLKYPQEWTGSFVGHSKSGMLEVMGDGLEFEHKERGLVVGRKADEGMDAFGRLVFGAKSGHGNLWFLG